MHNLKEEVYAKVKELSKTIKATSGALNRGDGCMCLEGLVLEAYRREHEGVFWAEPEWEGAPLNIAGLTHDIDQMSFLPREVLNWATVDGEDFRINKKIAWVAHDDNRRQLSLASMTPESEIDWQPTFDMMESE